VTSLSDLKVKIFADGADKRTMLEMMRNPLVKGFTTNPSLMRKAGVTDYATFARDVLSDIRDYPISFEVFADDFGEMERQAHIISSWGENVYVKVPVTNTKREPALDLICRLSHKGIKLNVTALLPLDQVRDVCSALQKDVPSYVSVFAGRIADTGRDPVRRDYGDRRPAAKAVAGGEGLARLFSGDRIDVLRRRADLGVHTLKSSSLKPTS
jgi:transaldolase